jgi:hypothetical protein
MSNTELPKPHVSIRSQCHLFCSHASSIAAGLERTGSSDGVWRLGPMDELVPPFVPIAVVFVYRTPSPTSELLPPARLKRAAERVLDYYPQLTGRLQFNASSNAPEIGQLGSGALLVEATCSNRRLDSLHDESVGTTTSCCKRLTVLHLPDGGNALLAPFDSSSDGVCREPLLSIQHTRFQCGSVALGIRIHHLVCDADGYFQFVRDLAQVYRAIRSCDGAAAALSEIALTHEPHIVPYLCDPFCSEQERQQALQYKPTIYQLAPTPSPTPPTTATPPSEEAATTTTTQDFAAAIAGPGIARVVGRVMRFSAPTLAALKAHASIGLPSGCWVSTFDALSALFYQRVHVARVQYAQSSGADVSQLSTDYLTSVNWRDASRLDLPQHYFPNAVICHYFTLPPDTLAMAPLSQIAQAVHDSVRMLSRQQAIDTLKWVVAQPDIRPITRDFRYANGGFMTSQWYKFDLYVNTDFDVDATSNTPIAPILVAPPFTPISLVDGLIYFVATEEQLTANTNTNSNSTSTSTSTTNNNDMAIDVYLALSEPLWPLLENDAVFSKFL